MLKLKVISLIIVGVVLTIFFLNRPTKNQPNITQAGINQLTLKKGQEKNEIKKPLEKKEVQEPTEGVTFSKQTTSIKSTPVTQNLQAGVDSYKYTLQVLPGWSVTRTQSIRTKEGSKESESLGEEVRIFLDKNNEYQIEIKQGGFSGYKCLYSGEVPRDNSNDELFKSYVEIKDVDGHVFRREHSSTKNNAENLADTSNFEICEYSAEEKAFYTPTKSYEVINFITPKNANEKILQEMDTMLASMKKVV